MALAQKVTKSHFVALTEEELKALIRRNAAVAPFRSSSKKPLAYKEMPLIQLTTGVDVGSSLCQVLSQAEQSIVGTAYCFDYPEGCRVLAAKQRVGVKVRVLLDHGQHRKPSCVNQPARVAELLERGVEFKVYRPPAGDKSCTRVKPWV